jgi:hypothetical protein
VTPQRETGPVGPVAHTAIVAPPIMRVRETARDRVPGAPARGAKGPVCIRLWLQQGSAAEAKVAGLVMGAGEASPDDGYALATELSTPAPSVILSLSWLGAPMVWWWRELGS